MRRVLFLVVVLHGAWAATILGQSPSLHIVLTDDVPPRVELRMYDLLRDGEFVGAMESGFPIYVEFRVQLRQSRSLWDRDVTSETFEYVVLYDPVRERYHVEEAGGSEIIPSRALLERRLAQPYVFAFPPDGEGSFYYTATVDVRTLDDSDVDEVFAWLKGEDVETRRPERPGVVTRLARRLLVAVAPLPRLQLEARTPSFSRP